MAVLCFSLDDAVGAGPHLTVLFDVGAGVGGEEGQAGVRLAALWNKKKTETDEIVCHKFNACSNCFCYFMLLLASTNVEQSSRVVYFSYACLCGAIAKYISG